MRTLADRWQRLALGIFSILTLAGCVVPLPPSRPTSDPPLSCDSFAEPYWREFTFGVDSAEDMDDIVAKTVRLWDLDSARVQIEPMSEKGVVIQWQVEFHDGADPRYSAYFQDDSKLSSVFFMWWHRKPTLALVIDCLGFPEYYVAYYRQDIEARSMTIELWYTGKGFVVRGHSLHGEILPPVIRPEYRMDNFVATKPGDLEQMVSTLYDPTPAALDEILCPLRPWPGSIEAIEVESYLENPRCEL